MPTIQCYTETEKHTKVIIVKENIHGDKSSSMTNKRCTRDLFKKKLVLKSKGKVIKKRNMRRKAKPLGGKYRIK